MDKTSIKDTQPSGATCFSELKQITANNYYRSISDNIVSESKTPITQRRKADVLPPYSLGTLMTKTTQ